MKSGKPLALLALAAAAGGSLGHSLSLLRLRPSLSQSPHYNQRKARKARRQRYAAGDRHAFRR